MADIALKFRFLLKRLMQRNKGSLLEAVCEDESAAAMAEDPLSQHGEARNSASRHAEALLSTFASDGTAEPTGAGPAIDAAQPGVLLMPRLMTAEAWTAHAQAYYGHLAEHGER